MRSKILLAAIGVMIAVGLTAAAAPVSGQESMVKIMKKTCPAPDGVKIVYSVAGAGEPALVFIHGGLANRGFWDGQLRAFAADHRTIAVDLPGHGDSGSNRKK